MKAFFQARGYPEALLNCDVCKISTVSRNEALRPPAERDSAESRVPLVLTYNQFNTGTIRILLDNFEMLLSDPATRTIYPELPLVSYRRKKPKGLSCTLCRRDRPRCWNVCLPSSLLLNVPTHHISDHFHFPSAFIPSVTASHASPRMWSIPTYVVVAVACTLVRLGGGWRNASVNTCVAFETILLAFLYPNISTLPPIHLMTSWSAVLNAAAVITPAERIKRWGLFSS